MPERETTGGALRSAVAELQFAARMVGLIEEDERIEFVPGSRSHGKAPAVNVRGPGGSRKLLELMPQFDSFTRGREVAVAMQAAAATLHHLRKVGAVGALA